MRIDVGENLPPAPLTLAGRSRAALDGANEPRPIQPVDEFFTEWQQVADPLTTRRQHCL